MSLNRDHYNTEYHRGILEKFHRETTYQRDKNNNVMQLVKPKQNDIILDVGCSSGGSSFLIAKSGANITGVDFDEQAIDVANEYRDRYPEIYSSCTFLVARAEDVISDLAPNKVIMIDFTEHVVDENFKTILRKLADRRADWSLYIYTPNRRHWIEQLKKRNWLIKQDPTHIALRDMRETVKILADSGFETTNTYFHPSHLPGIHYLELFFSKLPVLGSLFRRRLCIKANPISVQLSD